jgi:hypothetical protein
MNLMMNKSRKTGKKSPQSTWDLEETFTHIPEEMMHNLLRIIAECELDRWMRESDSAQKSSESSDLLGSKAKISAQSFVAVLQAVGSLRRGMSLDIIAQQNDLKHELINS